MQNITFWSNTAGKSGTSGNMLAISTMASILYSLKTLLVQFDGESNPLVQAFGGVRNHNALNEEFSFYNRKGLDEVWDKAQMKKIGKGEIDDNVVNVRHTNLYYMPPSRKSQSEQKTEFDDGFLRMLLDGMESFESINFIDCMKGKHPIQERLFADCDMIVVNIYQGMDYLDEIMDNREIREKAVFVVGRYDNQSRDSLGNIRRKYNIAKDSIGVVPYNIHFHDAVHEGRLVPFITKGIFNKKSDEDYEFIMALCNTTNMILRKAGYEGL